MAKTLITDLQMQVFSGSKGGIVPKTNLNSENFVLNSAGGWTDRGKTDVIMSDWNGESLFNDTILRYSQILIINITRPNDNSEANRFIFTNYNYFNYNKIYTLYFHTKEQGLRAGVKLFYDTSNIKFRGRNNVIVEDDQGYYVYTKVEVLRTFGEFFFVNVTNYECLR